MHSREHTTQRATTLGCAIPCSVVALFTRIKNTVSTCRCRRRKETVHGAILLSVTLLAGVNRLVSATRKLAISSATIGQRIRVLLADVTLLAIVFHGISADRALLAETIEADAAVALIIARTRLAAAETATVRTAVGVHPISVVALFPFLHGTVATYRSGRPGLFGRATRRTAITVYLVSVVTLLSGFEDAIAARNRPDRRR